MIFHLHSYSIFIYIHPSCRLLIWMITYISFMTSIPWNGTVVMVTALIFTGDVEDKLQRLQWIPGLSPWWPFCFMYKACILEDMIPLLRDLAWGNITLWQKDQYWIVKTVIGNSQNNLVVKEIADNMIPSKEPIFYWQTFKISMFALWSSWSQTFIVLWYPSQQMIVGALLPTLFKWDSDMYK